MEVIEKHESGLAIEFNGSSTYFVVDTETRVVFECVPTLRRAKNAFKRTLKFQGLL